MKTRYFLFGSLLLTGLILTFWFAGLARAQEPQPGPDRLTLGPDAPDVHSDFIPIQGVLTDAAGNPLDGDFPVTYRLYGDYYSTTPLCTKTSLLEVDQGLFTGYMNAAGCPIDGRILFLGIQVGEDAEMTPRQYIDNVPYAWSLRPGAVISDTLASTSILHIENWGSGGRGLRSYAMDQGSVNFGVVGASRSSTGYGGYFYNNGGGIGLYASSSAAANPALIASGTDSGPDIILGGNADTGVGDDGVLASDPAYVSSDILIKANDTVRVDLDNDGDGEDADFEIRDKDDTLLFDVDDSGAVVFGGPGIAAFPRPAYDSGWVTIAAGNSIALTHNLGGNVDNYVVELTFKHPTYGVHHFGYGADVTVGGFYGGYWRNLTTSQITIERATDDGECPQMRVRIWMYP